MHFELEGQDDREGIRGVTKWQQACDICCAGRIGILPVCRRKGKYSGGCEPADASSMVRVLRKLEGRGPQRLLRRQWPARSPMVNQNSVKTGYFLD